MEGLEVKDRILDFMYAMLKGAGQKLDEDGASSYDAGYYDGVLDGIHVYHHMKEDKHDCRGDCNRAGPDAWGLCDSGGSSKEDGTSTG